MHHPTEIGGGRLPMLVELKIPLPDRVAEPGGSHRPREGAVGRSKCDRWTAGCGGDRVRSDAELSGRGGRASQRQVGMCPGMVSGFVAFGDALREPGISHHVLDDEEERRRYVVAVEDV